MWCVVKIVSNKYKYWLQIKEGKDVWSGLRNNACKFAIKEEAAKLAIDYHSKTTETTIEKV